jgi:HPt (histidine-containing phosphotransfer) domain-containing protein
MALPIYIRMTNLNELNNKKLDTRFLYSIYEGDTEHAAIVFENFLKTSPNQITDIKQTYTTGNVEEFRRKMHKVKPIFSFVGLTNLTIKAEIIEKTCLKISELENVNELFVEFLDELEDFLPIVKEEYKRLIAA